MNLMQKTLQDGLPSLKLTLDEQRCEQLCAFGAAMVKQNEVMTLTGITEDAAVAKLLSALPTALQTELQALFEEMNAREINIIPLE